MICLAIESSCDETSLAILETKDFEIIKNENLSQENFKKVFKNTEVLSQIVSSQIDIHKIYGGVIPEIGAREHAKAIHNLFKIIILEASKKKNLEEKDILDNIEKIYVTSEPGLKAGLRVGIEFAKSIKFFLEKNPKKSLKDIQIKYQNHLRGHVASCFYQANKIKKTSDNSLSNNLNSDIFPHLHLLVSGGNTQMILLNSWSDWKIVGKTLDDAAGECFDKVGRMVGLPYPAGVWISKIAGMNDQNPINFTVGMSKKPGLDFSYSGLKTAVRYFVQKQKIEDFKFEKRISKAELDKLLEEGDKNSLNNKLKMIYDICISSQSVITDQLTIKVKRSIKEFNPKTIGISGGVSANQLLRNKIQNLSKKEIMIPPIELTGDNAVMIALAGLCNELYQA